MTPKLADLTLRHVDPSKLLLERTDITGDIPRWFNDSAGGTFQCFGWYGGAVLAVMEMTLKHQFYVTTVAVAGMFGTDEQMTVRTPQTEKDDVLLKEATEEEMSDFARRAVSDLYPFLRQELYSLTGKFGGVVGVMLAPGFTLARPGETPPRSDEGSA